MACHSSATFHQPSRDILHDSLNTVSVASPCIAIRQYIPTQVLIDTRKLNQLTDAEARAFVFPHLPIPLITPSRISSPIHPIQISPRPGARTSMYLMSHRTRVFQTSCADMRLRFVGKNLRRERSTYLMI